MIGAARATHSAGRLGLTRTLAGQDLPGLAGQDWAGQVGQPTQGTFDSPLPVHQARVAVVTTQIRSSQRHTATTSSLNSFSVRFTTTDNHRDP